MREIYEGEVIFELHLEREMGKWKGHSRQRGKSFPKKSMEKAGDIQGIIFVPWCCNTGSVSLPKF